MYIHTYIFGIIEQLLMNGLRLIGLHCFKVVVYFAEGSPPERILCTTPSIYDKVTNCQGCCWLGDDEEAFFHDT